jgi:Zn-dependent M28 family amino/carboxypeptidase
VNHRTKSRLQIGAIAASTAVAGSLILAGTAQAAPRIDTSNLTGAVTPAGVMEHLTALQAIADANGGTRAAGTPGHEASVAYMADLLEGAGYDITLQPFSYENVTILSSSLAQTAPSPTSYVENVDYVPMEFTGAGDVTAPVAAVDINLVGDRASTSGCEDADFAGFTPGHIALIQRGTCTFGEKADNAAEAGAVGAIIFNQGNGGPDRTDLFGGTLGDFARDIPVVSVSFPQGEAWANTAGLTLRLAIETDVDEITTNNLLADTTTGRADRTVVVGGHLDSVEEGPGINDNGSGTATILEVALQMAELGIEPENRVRFAFWSGEEDGLIGSSYYVSQLTAKQVKQHALNLNFDMIGSPNSVNFVYDGDGDAFGTSGPNGSDIIEGVFADFFTSQGAFTEPTEFDGRSDYFGFIEAGIPAGGLFTGAEGIKTAEEAAKYGGTAGIAYDPCYHQACDGIGNLSLATLDIMSDAVAHATLTFAETESAVNGTSKGKANGKFEPEFKGSFALR